MKRSREKTQSSEAHALYTRAPHSIFDTTWSFQEPVRAGSEHCASNNTHELLAVASKL